MSIDLSFVSEEILSRRIKHVFGIPGGGTSLELLDKLITGNVNFHATHFEGSAAIMGGVVGKLSGVAGVAVSIKGPGFANMLSGLSFCSLECLPIVGIVEAYGVDAPISAAHKRMSHKELSMGVVKDRFDLTETGTGVSHAFSLATVEIPGPVLLELAETANSSTMCGQSNSIVSTPTEDLSSYIDASRSPIIIAGSLCVRENLSKQLETLNIPVFSTVSAKGVVNELMSHSAGIFTGVGLELTPEFELISKADLVIGIGLRNTEVLAATPFDCPSINFDKTRNKTTLGFEQKTLPF